MRKTIVVLANSVKHNKHCVAGKCINTKEWIRPVSDSFGKELTNQQTTYSNKYGQYIVKPKQKIEMNFQSQVPLIHQPDNYLIDNNQWIQRYKIDDAELYEYLDTPTSLWGNYNRIPYADIINKQIVISQSLYLVKSENLTLYYTKDQKRRAKFNYNSIGYDLPATDPEFDKIISDGKSISGIICISLGEEYNGFCYKIVATLF